VRARLLACVGASVAREMGGERGEGGEREREGRGEREGEGRGRRERAAAAHWRVRGERDGSGRIIWRVVAAPVCAACAHSGGRRLLGRHWGVVGVLLCSMSKN